MRNGEKIDSGGDNDPPPFRVGVALRTVMASRAGGWKALARVVRPITAAKTISLPKATGRPL